MLLEMASMAAGLLLLLAGRRMFWLAVGLAAFLRKGRALGSLAG